MTIVFDGTPHRYYLDENLKANLDVAKDVIKEDWDMIFCVDGGEGTGKSVLAQQSAFYCDQTLDIDRVAFTPEEFRSCVLAAEPYQAVIYDEAYTGLSSRAAMSHINRALVQMLAEIRQKNLFIFVVAPSFLDMDRYLALWRSRGLLHVYTGENFQRGFFAFYNVDRKKMLYIDGKKYYDYRQTKPNFIGRFTKPYLVDEIAYKQKKRNSLRRREAKAENEQDSRRVQLLLEQRLFALGDSVKPAIKIAISGLTRITYYRHLKTWEDSRDDTEKDFTKNTEGVQEAEEELASEEADS